MRATVTAAFLGWMLDAFDFFIVVFLFQTLQHQFGVPRAYIVLSVTATLAMRPVGAVLFGMLADRYGRRLPLMANVIYFAVIEIACGFSPNFTVFLILRALFGIGMGGEWGVGAALVMESAPKKWRGVLSGLLQSGYPVGYLLAALASRFILPAYGWRMMFWMGGLPALLALYIRFQVPESEAWREQKVGSVRDILRSLRQGGKRAGYLIALMALMNFLSHGTQDLYPDFLATVHHIAQPTVAWVAVLYNVGAVLGAFAFGLLSEPLGRRRSMLVALCVSLVVLPFWAFGGSLLVLTSAAFLMQVGVQGAWGIIPVHLNELAPDATRGLLPGFSYQIGVLIAAPVNNYEVALGHWLGDARAMAAFELVIILAVAAVLWRGPESRGKDFLSAPVAEDGKRIPMPAHSPPRTV